MTGRTYGKILVSVWRDEGWVMLSTEAQWLYMQLISQPNLSSCGVLPLQITKWAKGSGDMTAERIIAAGRELANERMIFSDSDTEEVLIRTYIRHDIIGQGTPKVLKGALSSALRVQSKYLRQALLHEIQNLGRILPDDQRALVDELEASVQCSPKREQQHLPPTTATTTQPFGWLPNGNGKAFESLSGPPSGRVNSFGESLNDDEPPW